MGAGASFHASEDEKVDILRARELAGAEFDEASWQDALSSSSSTESSFMTGKEWNARAEAYLESRLRSHVFAWGEETNDEEFFCLQRPGLAERDLADECWYIALGSLCNLDVLAALRIAPITSLRGNAAGMRIGFVESDAVGIVASNAAADALPAAGIVHKVNTNALSSIDSSFLCIRGVERRSVAVSLELEGGGRTTVNSWMHCIREEKRSSEEEEEEEEEEEAASRGVVGGAMLRTEPEARLLELMIQLPKQLFRTLKLPFNF